MYITEHYLRKVNKRNKAQIQYNTALPVIFGVKYFADALWKVANQRDIQVNLKSKLVEVHGDKNTAIFANVDNPSQRTSVEVSILEIYSRFLSFSQLLIWYFLSTPFYMQCPHRALRQSYEHLRNL